MTMQIQNYMKELGISAGILSLIGMGKFPGLIPVRLSGINADVDTTDEGIWEKGGAFTWLSAAEKLQVKSSDGKDTSDGVGARTIEITGLDADYAIQTETVIMSGAAAKETANTYLRFLGAEVKTVGTELDNAGNITINDNADTNTIGYIPAGYNKSSGVYFTVPVGKTLYVCSLNMSESNIKIANFAIIYKKFGSPLTKSIICSIENNTSNIFVEFPYKIEEKSDVYVVAASPDSDAYASCILFGFYETN